ncbi:MAG TPA: hypothetical protein VFR23_17850 [Jiangellaceae bacterium]|nr:hypothetical protein [Jiangellaceae bacterium]
MDRDGGSAKGCVRHGAAMLASLAGARVHPGSVEGAAIETFERAQKRRPFDFVSG